MSNHKSAKKTEGCLCDTNLSDIAVGVDIEDVKRFRNLDLKRNRAFLRRVFTDTELRYCFSKKSPAPHLAVRFAAKEAAFKAIDSLGGKKTDFQKIKVEKDASGSPFIKLKGYEIKIGLSHCEDKAICFAMVKKGNS